LPALYLSFTIEVDAKDKFIGSVGFYCEPFLTDLKIATGKTV
jgi:hypothetical protein